MENKSYREGFEAGLILCLKVMEKSGSKEAVLARLDELKALAKDHKIERLKELLKDENP